MREKRRSEGKSVVATVVFSKEKDKGETVGVSKGGEGKVEVDVGAGGERGGGVFVGQGPVLTMGFLRPGGGEVSDGQLQHVGHAEVEKLAGLENIQLRTGCFCNPGACQRALGFSDDDVRENLKK